MAKKGLDESVKYEVAANDRYGLAARSSRTPFL